MPVGQRSGKNVDEFSPGVLKTREHLALVGQRHQKGFERFSRSPLRSQQVVGVATARSAPNHLQSLARRHSLRPFLVPTQLLQQQCRSHAERAGQRDQGF